MLAPGLSAQVSHRVEEADLASAYGNPGADVLATMVLATLLEQAALKALEGELSPDEICVGTRLDFHHLAPTPPGFSVTAEAKLTKIDRRRLVFEVFARDEVETVARGVHERFILKKVKFQSQVAAKKGKLKP